MIRQEPATLTARDGATFEVMLHFDDAAPQRTAILMMHPSSDWRQHTIIKLLAERGFGALGCTNRYLGREAELILEDAVVDWAACVDHLRARGYAKVIGIGYSGGGEIVTGYHAQAVHPSITGTPTGDGPDFTRMKLSSLDGLVMFNSHAGRPISITAGLDPSVGGEDGNDPLVYVTDLDMFNEANGPPFSDAFRTRYAAAQTERNHKITRWCRHAVARMRASGNPLLRDIVFIVHRSDANLRFLDKALDASARSGRTIWGDEPHVANYTPGPLRGNNVRLKVLTVRSWLSSRGLESSQFDVMAFMPECNIPTVVICGTADEGGTEQSRRIFEAAPDAGKRLVWIEGGTHFMRGQEDKQAEVAETILAFARTRGLM